MATVLYFSEFTRLDVIRPMPNAQFMQAFGPDVWEQSHRHDSYSRVVGFVGMSDSYDHQKKRWNRDAFIGAMPVTRVIFRKANPSNHKCDHRCRHAKGSQCECSCGGQFHGAGA